MLPLDHSGFIFFVHALNCLASVIAEVLIAGLDGILNIDDFLFPEVLEVHVFGSAYFLLILVDFDLHLVNEADPHRVQKLVAETGLHVSKNNKEKGSAALELPIFGFELLFLVGADNCIEKATDC